MERRCKRCEQTLPLSAFNRYKDGHQWWCRECFREYFKDRGDLHRQQVRRSLDARRELAREYVLERLRGASCVDCGENNPVVLEFDHLANKTRTVAALVSSASTINSLRAEIDKCEVVCCNCHRRRTYLRRGQTRTTEGVQRIKRWRRRRNVEVIYARLAYERCVDCGIQDPLVLEFDHIGVKRMDVMQMAWAEYSLETIELEIANCDVRCANCHRWRTAERAGHYRHRVGLAQACETPTPDGPLA